MRRRGFTLMEIMIVIGIIVVLVSMATIVGSGMVSNAKVKKTKQILQSLHGIAEDYKRDGGRLPTAGTPGSNDANDPMVVFLNSIAPYNQPPTPWGKQLQSVGPDLLKRVNGQVFFYDGFQQSIRFLYNYNSRPFVFQSAGPNGVYGDADDIYDYDP